MIEFYSMIQIQLHQGDSKKLHTFLYLFSIEISHLASDDPGDIIIDDDNCEEIKTIISYN